MCVTFSLETVKKCRIMCIFRPVIITDVLTDWKANNWSRDFFMNEYGDQKVVMKAVRVCSLVVFFIIYSLHFLIFAT